MSDKNNVALIDFPLQQVIGVQWSPNKYYVEIIASASVAGASAGVTLAEGATVLASKVFTDSDTDPTTTSWVVWLPKVTLPYPEVYAVADRDNPVAFGGLTNADFWGPAFGHGPVWQMNLSADLVFEPVNPQIIGYETVLDAQEGRIPDDASRYFNLAYLPGPASLADARNFDNAEDAEDWLNTIKEYQQHMRADYEARRDPANHQGYQQYYHLMLPPLHAEGSEGPGLRLDALSTEDGIQGHHQIYGFPASTDAGPNVQYIITEVTTSPIGPGFTTCSFVIEIDPSKFDPDNVAAAVTLNLSGGNDFFDGTPTWNIGFNVFTKKSYQKDENDKTLDHTVDTGPVTVSVGWQNPTAVSDFVFSFGFEHSAIPGATGSPDGSYPLFMEKRAWRENDPLGKGVPNENPALPGKIMVMWFDGTPVSWNYLPAFAYEVTKNHIYYKFREALDVQAPQTTDPGLISATGAPADVQPEF